MLEADAPPPPSKAMSGIIGVASALVSRDADDDAQDMVGLSRVYKSSGPSNAGVTSPDVDDDVAGL